MIQITAGELNFLVFRYLQGAGFTHSAFTLGCEACLSDCPIDGNMVPPQALIKCITKGLQYLEMEADLSNGWSPCSLAIQDDKGIHIVARGDVEVTSEVIPVHNESVANGFRLVKVLEEIMSYAKLPCPTEEFTFVCQAMESFVQWPVHLIFPKTEADKQQSSPFATESPQTPSSSQASNNKKYVITNKDQAKLTTILLRNFKREAMNMKLEDAFISITIPSNVYGHQHNVSIDYEDMLDWCFQREIGANHMSIFMKYLSEKCREESISWMYGFCDFNYLSPLTPINDDEERVDYLARVFGQNEGMNMNQLFFAPYNENRHWMLAVISPWNGTVFWLDPAGAKNDIREFAQTIINDGIKRFSLKYRMNFKKFQKYPKIKWNKPECPRQSQDSKDCGYYICWYMLETIEKRLQKIPEQYFGGAPTAYSQMKIDQLRDMWIKCVHEYKSANA